MLKMRILCFLAALCCAWLVAAKVTAAEVDSDGVYCFTREDFSQEELTGICITGVPGEEAGVLCLGQRVLRAGDILTAEQVEQMVFCPVRSEEDASACLSYLPVFADRVDGTASMTISIRGKEDMPPAAEDFALETYKNLPLEGVLKVKDPEGQALSYTVIRQPRRGTVTVNEDGSFTYTPKKNKVGVDSFVYTATDPAGKTSREATVTVTILKPTDAAQYTDTLGKDCRFAAEWMKNTGIFTAESVAGNACFQPEKEVTRGEFVTMLVRALELPTREALEYTEYGEDVPGWLQPYLAAAVRSGLMAGLPEERFAPAEPITGAEAAVMIQNALDLGAKDQSAPDETVPAWAADALSILGSHGFDLTGEDTLTRGQAAVVLYRTVSVSGEAPGMQILRMGQQAG